MGGLFGADQLAGMRTTVISSFDTPVTLQRLQGSVYNPVGAATTCLVTPGTGTVSYPGLPSILALTPWVVTLPWNADVRVGDRLVTPYATYYVQRMEQPASYNVDTTVHCYQLFDSSAAPVYLPINATIRLTHQDGTLVYDSRRVQLVWPLVTDPIQPAGARIAGYLYDAPTPTYTLLDTVTLLEEDGFSAVQSPPTYSVDLVQFLSDGPPLVRVHLMGTNR